jgi:anthranilate synthase component 2
MILMIDNYDSFTYNLVQEMAEISGHAIEVVRNDAAGVTDLLGLAPEAIVISPGPGTPEDAGVSMELIRAAQDVPLLGICLGLQSLAQVHGGRIVRAPAPVHGKTSMMHHDDTALFRGLPNPLEATRYHSLIVDRATLPERLAVTAWTEDDLVMAVEDRRAPHVAVQFHPESYLSRHGMDILARFLRGAGIPLRDAWNDRLTGEVSG